MKMHVEKDVLYEKSKIASSPEIYKTMCHNGSYLLLLEKKKLLSFEVSCKKFICL